MVKYQSITGLNTADSITNTDKLIIEKNTASDATKYSKAEKLKVYIPVKNHYGEVITSALPIDDDSLHLLDGSQLTSTNYPEFYTYMSNLYSSSANYFFHPYSATLCNFELRNGATMDENGILTLSNSSGAAKQYIISKNTYDNLSLQQYSQGRFALHIKLYNTSYSQYSSNASVLFSFSDEDSSSNLRTIQYYNRYRYYTSFYDSTGASSSAPTNSSQSFSYENWFYITTLVGYNSSLSTGNNTSMGVNYSTSSDPSEPSLYGFTYSPITNNEDGPRHILIGNTLWDMDGFGFNGQIDLNNTYITRNGTEIWRARGRGTVTAEEQWQEENTTYGVVGKYAYDANFVIRIPKINNIKDYVYSGTNLGNVSQINYNSGSEKLTTMKQYNYVVVK